MFFFPNLVISLKIPHQTFKMKTISFSKPLYVLSMFLIFLPLKPYVLIYFVLIKKRVFKFSFLYLSLVQIMMWSARKFVKVWPIFLIPRLSGRIVMCWSTWKILEKPLKWPENASWEVLFKLVEPHDIMSNFRSGAAAEQIYFTELP